MMEFKKVSGYIGVEISGVDLRAEKSAEAYADIRAALNENGVIFFRDQKLEPIQFQAFGERFGELFINNSPAIKSLPDYPMIEDMKKEVDQTSIIGDEWHTDQAHREKPCQFTILQSVVSPEFGGDTLFINTAAAYDTLSEEIKETISNLRAVNSSAFIMANALVRQGDPDGLFANIKNATAIASHPVVTTHPENGRKVLYVNPGYTERFEGWTRDESLSLLNMLYLHAQRPEYGCRFRWRPDSIAMWDNRQTWHYACNDYHGQRRVMRRMVVKAQD
jgi:taurine dioxygenase